MHRESHGQPAHRVSAAKLRGFFRLLVQRADLLFQAARHGSVHNHAVGAAQIALNFRIKGVSRHAQRFGGDQRAHADHGDFRCSRADINHHAAARLRNAQPSACRSQKRLLHK